VGSRVKGEKNHVFNFFLDPQLVTDVNLAKESLEKYIDDLNFVLAKNTNRHLLFDPETGVIVTDN
jgi:hypothetical protein